MNELIQKYKKMSLPLRATLWFTVCQFLQKGISMLSTPFFTRLLPTDQYGFASTFASWESIFLILVAFSSSHGIMNLYTKRNDYDAVTSGVMGFGIVISGIWGLVFVFFHERIESFMGLSQQLVICLFLFCVFQSIFQCWTAQKQYEYRYKEIVTATLLYTIGSSIGGLLAVVFFFQTAEAKILPQTVSVVVIGSVLWICTFRKGKVFFDKDVWRFTLGFCFPLLPHYLSEVVLQSSDRIMINKLCGASEVAIYSVAYSVGSLIGMVTSAVNAAFAPYQYQKIKSKEYDVLAKNTNYIIAFVALCLCCIMLFAREIVLLFGGQKYIDSIDLIVPICLGVYFNYVFQLFARVQQYFEQKNTIVIASVSCALLNIVLNYIFIQMCGYSAAAYTTFACYFIFCFLHYLFYRKACKKHIGKEIYDIRSLTIISFFLIVVSILLQTIRNLYILKYVILLILVVVVLINKKRILNFIKKLR